MKRVYVKAVWIGVALAFFVLFSFATLYYDFGTLIPGWDFDGDNNFIDPAPAKDLSPGVILDLQHKAVLLRFCMLTGEHGMSVLAISVGICLVFALLEDCEEKYYLVTCLRRGLKQTGVILLGVLTFFIAPMLFGIACSGLNSIESSLLNLLNILWILLPIGVIAIGPIIFLAAFFCQLCTNGICSTMTQQRSRTLVNSSESLR